MTLLETNRLDTLTNNVLVSAQLEADKYNPAKEELDFSDLLKTTITDFKHRSGTAMAAGGGPGSRSYRRPAVVALLPGPPPAAIAVPGNGV